MNATVRNVLIVLALAAIVAFVPHGGTAAGIVTQLLSLVFFAALAWFAAIFYRQNRVTLMSLAGRDRLLLYGSIGLVALTATATARLWSAGPAGIGGWFALLALASAGVFSVYRSYQKY